MTMCNQCGTRNPTNGECVMCKKKQEAINFMPSNEGQEILFNTIQTEFNLNYPQFLNNFDLNSNNFGIPFYENMSFPDMTTPKFNQLQPELNYVYSRVNSISSGGDQNNQSTVLIYSPINLNMEDTSSPSSGTNRQDNDQETDGIWVCDKYSGENMYYYGIFPSSILSSPNGNDIDSISQSMSQLLFDTNLEDDIAEVNLNDNLFFDFNGINTYDFGEQPYYEIKISNAAKRLILGVYFQFIYPFFPILNKKKILHDFNQGKLPVLLLNAICAITYPYISQENKKLFPMEIQQKSVRDACIFFEAEAKKCLDECFSESEIYTIQALLLLTLNNYRSTFSNNVWLYSGMATRMAMELGLHKDCENLINGSFEMEEQEIRKKTWWGCYILDTIYCTILGRPLSIQTEQCDVKLCKTPDGINPFAIHSRTFIATNDRGNNKRPIVMVDSDEMNETKEALIVTIFLSWCKLADIYAKLNKLITSIKLTRNLQDRSKQAKECLDSIARWYKNLPNELKKLNPNMANMINSEDSYQINTLLPLLHLFYHAANIICVSLIHTDSHLAIPSNKVEDMKMAFASTDIISHIMKDFSNYYTQNGPPFKFYPLYLAGFFTLFKVKHAGKDFDPKFMLNIVMSKPGDQLNYGNASLDKIERFQKKLTEFYDLLSIFKNGIGKYENAQFGLDILVGVAKQQLIPVPGQFVESVSKPASTPTNQSLVPATNNMKIYNASSNDLSTMFELFNGNQQLFKSSSTQESPGNQQFIQSAQTSMSSGSGFDYPNQINTSNRESRMNSFQQVSSPELTTNIQFSNQPFINQPNVYNSNQQPSQNFNQQQFPNNQNMIGQQNYTGFRFENGEFSNDFNFKQEKK